MKWFVTRVCLQSDSDRETLIDEFRKVGQIYNQKVPIASLLFAPLDYYNRLNVIIQKDSVIVTRCFQFMNFSGIGMNVKIVSQIVDIEDHVILECEIMPHVFWRVAVFLIFTLLVINILKTFASGNWSYAWSSTILLSVLVSLLVFIYFIKISLLKLFCKQFRLTLTSCT